MDQLDQFLRSTDVIDWQQPDVLALARELRGDGTDPVVVARRCFGWVRDSIQHTQDFGLSVVTCSASEALREGSGYCYAKSHLLAALLRANGLPAGLCYQRVSTTESTSGFCLHGLNAVLLPGTGWYRVDARGNRPGIDVIDAQFTPPVERLAFTMSEGDADVPGVWADPLPIVVEKLRGHATVETLKTDLPDLATSGL
jgi:transglutaminase-like putative cysteine protease